MESERAKMRGVEKREGFRLSRLLRRRHLRRRYPLEYPSAVELSCPSKLSCRCRALNAAETELQTREAVQGCVILLELSRAKFQSLGLRKLSKISGVMHKASKRNFSMIGFMVLIALLPVAASKFFGGSNEIQMYSDDYRKMNQEILRNIPVGSSAQSAKQMMTRNGFRLSGQDQTSLSFQKEETYLPFGEGTQWAVAIDLKKGSVSGAKTWIGPAD